MAEENFDDLNNTEIEAPGGTQATHSAADSESAHSVNPHPSGRRARVVHRLTSARDAGVNYVRETDMMAMRSDLETHIRERPIASMAIALLGGYLLAKIVD